MAAGAKAATKKAAAAKPETNPLATDRAVVERPDGLPGLWPLHAMPRKRKAAAFRKVQEVSNLMGSIGEAREKIALLEAGGGTELDKLSMSGTVADFYELSGEIEELLNEVAEPGQEANVAEWTSKADDRDLLAAFAWYMQTFQPGEARSSQGS